MQGRHKQMGPLCLCHHRPECPGYWETHLLWEEETVKREGGIRPGSLLHKSLEGRHLSEEVGAATWNHPGSELGFPKSAGLWPLQTLPLAQHRGGDCFAGSCEVQCPRWLGQMPACLWTQAHSACSPLGVTGETAAVDFCHWELGPGAWQSWNVLGQLLVSRQRQPGDESHDQSPGVAGAFLPGSRII